MTHEDQKNNITSMCRHKLGQYPRFIDRTSDFHDYPIIDFLSKLKERLK